MTTDGKVGMDLIQSNGQPCYGRFEQIPTSIDVNRYEYKTPYGKTLKGWRKQLKYKKFKFCGIQHAEYTIGVAIADIGWAGHGFIYVYNHETQEVLFRYARRFLAVCSGNSGRNYWRKCTTAKRVQKTHRAKGAGQSH